MTPEQEAVLKVIYKRATQFPEYNLEKIAVNIDDLNFEPVALLIASRHLKQNANGKVRLTPTGLVVARRPGRTNASAQDDQS